MSVILVEKQAKVTTSQTFNLVQALDGLSKDALTLIRQNAGIKNVSKLNREQLKLACIEMLPEALTKELPTITTLFDQSRTQRLMNVVKGNGTIVMTEEVTEQEIQYWKQLGLLFYEEQGEKKLFRMPEELIEVVRQHLNQLNMRMIEQNQNVIEAVKGMLYYYGCLTHDQLTQIVNRYDGLQQMDAPLMHLIINYSHYKTDYRLNDQYIYHITIPDPTLIVREQAKRDELTFAEITISGLKQAGKPNFVLRTEAHRLLVERLMKELSLNKQEALLIADQCEFGVRAGLQLNDLVQYVIQELVIKDEAQITKLVPSIVLLCNQTSQWLLKGHTATQLRTGSVEAIDAHHTNAATKTIGRNDPCYCGSGKKYKKCCIHK